MSTPSGKEELALLIVYSPDSKLLGRSYPLCASTVELTVGRHKDNTILVDSDGISRHHARFERRIDGWWVVDGNSTNGTFVNDEQIFEAPLRTGDQIRAGNVIIRLVRSDTPIYCGGAGYQVADIDGLTRLHNRRYFQGQLEANLKSAARTGQPLTLILFDLDHFKKVNDVHGHLAGDRLLKEIASLAQSLARPDDVVARHGGEEFVLLLPQTDLASAVALAEKLRAAIAGRTFAFEKHKLKITISLGVAQANQQTLAPHDLFTLADDKLYEAKRGGRNRVCS